MTDEAPNDAHQSDEREARWSRWQEWMAAAQRGDGTTYEKLLRELTPHLRAFVQRRLFDTAAAEDVVQNVLVSVHRARHTYRSERPFGPWLHAIARNAVIDHIRSRSRRRVSTRIRNLRRASSLAMWRPTNPVPPMMAMRCCM